ncbi:hypothetical protein ACFLRM_02635 [Acidobacteriota bacterium]
MKSKKFVFFVIGIIILCSLDSFAETKKLEQIGRYTLVRIKGQIPTEEVMKAVLDNYAGDIKYGFDLAGYGNLYLPFIEQMRAASFDEKELPVGTHFLWMLYRSGGKVKVVEDLEWAGKEPLPVFSFNVEKDLKLYEFIMPKPCGNISLLNVTEAAVPDAICDIKVTPSKANIKDPISVDMSGSQNAKTMEVEVFDSGGAKITSKTLPSDSPTWQVSFDKPGEYVFRGKALNVRDKASGNACEAKTYINTPPVCSLIARPSEEYAGKTILFDATGSSDSDGEVAKVVFEISDSDGNVIDQFSDSEKPFNWESVFEEPGLYNCTAVATDDLGAMSAPCRVDVNIKEKKLRFFIEAGPALAKGSHGKYLFGRVGLLYKIVPDKLSFLLSGGGALTLDDEPWKSFFMANALLNLHAGAAFFGAGVGYSTEAREEREAGLDLVGNVGFNIFDSGALFGELRAPVGKDRSFTNHHKILLGFRYLF